MDEEDKNRRSEYTEVCESIRHNFNIRFSVLTVFVALTGGLVVALFSENPLPSFALEILKWGGALVALAFWIMDERARKFRTYCEGRARDLEGLLNYYHLKRPEEKQRQLLMWPDGLFVRLLIRLRGKHPKNPTRLHRLCDYLISKEISRGGWIMNAQFATRLIYIGVIVFWAMTCARPEAFLRSKKDTAMKAVSATNTLYIGP